MPSAPAKLRKKMRQLLALNNNQWTPEALGELAQMLGVVIPNPETPVAPAAEGERKIHPAAKYLRRISSVSLFLGVARMMPPSLFWWQMSFIWLAGVLFLVDAFFEDWK